MQDANANNQALASSIGEEVSKQIAAATLKVQKEQVLDPSAQVLRDQILANAEFFISLYGNNMEYDTGPTVITHRCGKKVTARVSGTTIDEDSGEVCYFDFMQSLTGNTDMASLRALYNTSKVLVERALETTMENGSTGLSLTKGSDNYQSTNL